MTAQSKFVENIKPRIGMTVRLTTNPGLWQVLDRAPGVGLWWMLAYDEEARGGDSMYSSATYREMRKRDWVND
ncbi:hypothetical protein SAMN04489740_2720 [Arthrobacter alpinus]|uniref:Uncharacterized protein n=1 Tax=Arthrobacter alpinus TaxID=656366 RepID=A0A1H5M4B6_9MICC|nr:hypothetical protein [Arthrobacter alpinus]SEE83471.1 hypothetical protein SAMN04489740_2720 [Arthrobacter alpinus]